MIDTNNIQGGGWSLADHLSLIELDLLRFAETIGAREPNYTTVEEVRAAMKDRLWEAFAGVAFPSVLEFLRLLIDRLDDLDVAGAYNEGAATVRAVYRKETNND